MGAGAGKRARTEVPAAACRGPFILDFYCAAARLVVEVDGAVHRGERVHLDRLRDEALVASGLRVLRVTASEVERDVDKVVVRIRSLL